MMPLLHRGAGPSLEAPVPDLLIDQLWRPATSAGAVRLTHGGRAPGWEEVERYLVVPSLERPVMLLPDLPPSVLAGTVRRYRRLRSTRAQLQRSLVAAAISSRLPLPVPRLSVQVRTGEGPSDLPLARIREALDDADLYASIGVRRGANRKATLQLVDGAGTPRGFAKVAWDPASAAGIEREAAALGRVPRTGPAHVPELLATGSAAGWPFLVTAPLPADVRAVRASAPPPTAAELGSLCPVSRRAPLGRTGQASALVRRLEDLRPTPETAQVLPLARTVLARLASSQVPVPITAQWHGDLTPWNCARGTDGALWAWDWESSEADAVAGLDVCHWSWTVRSERGERLRRDTVPLLVAEADPLLVAFGVPRARRPAVGALWAVTIAERACSLAAARGDWDAGWVLPHELHRLLVGALDVLTDAGAGGAR